MCVCASMQRSLHIATSLSPTRARDYSLNINPKPESISGPIGLGSGSVADLITMLEECCPWYILTAKQKEMPQISPQILRKDAAKSVILGRKNQKKVPRNPGGTGKVLAVCVRYHRDHI